MKIFNETEYNVFKKGHRVRFKRDVQLLGDGSAGISFEMISAGTEGIIHTVLPFIVHVNSDNNYVKEVLWDQFDGIEDSLEIIRDSSVLRLVK